MTWIEYPYTGFWVKERLIKRPLIDVEIAYQGSRTTQLAVIDSGAEMTMISGDLAQMLDIDVATLERTTVGGIMGGTPDAYVCPVTITVEGFQDESFKADAVFVPGLRVNILLGQYDFFENFRVQFSKDIDVFKLSRVQKEPQPENLA